MDGQLEFPLKSARRVAINVTQLVRIVRETLEVNLDEYWVVGEVSNARLAPSNHLYFTLKDARSSVSAVMFSSAYRRLRFRLEDGMKIVVRGRINLYEARGTLQFYAEEIEPRGAGALQMAFEQLKQRLGAEGLFDDARKRPLPFLPRTIGIVTALGGAALRDMLRILIDRCPNLHIIVRASRVQGPGAAAEIAAAIADLNRDGRAEVIIAGRGGGSLEDLWAFNEEVVARAIFVSAIPIVSAVGHEIDYTIADFVADLRAPTPTAAAQMVVQETARLRRRVAETAASLTDAIEGAIASHRREIDHFDARLREPVNLIRQARQRADEAASDLRIAITARLQDLRRSVREFGMRVTTPLAMVREFRLHASQLAIRLAQTLREQANPLRLAVAEISARLDETNLRAALVVRRTRIETLGRRLETAIDSAVETRRIRLGGIAKQLDAVSPLKVLDRGYAVIVNRRDGRTVADASAVEIGDELDVRLRRGRLNARTIGREV
ncbi:MAG: exodeoxyribonuclease large subunit [Candidatus Binataceae bacterium]|jgi:exodeoxyribonuclease VII large subunit|nr:exodeoxyribonuclease large subunit [Candidatus Binataceae bacterium]